MCESVTKDERKQLVLYLLVSFSFSCRDDLEKCQLLHTIQLLKLQTSQKQLVIDTCHNKQASQIEELRELLADAQHEKKLLSLQVQSLSHGYEQELKRTRERLEEERAKVCKENEEQRDCETAREEVKQELELALSTCTLLDEAQYRNLKSADSAGLPIDDLVRVSSCVGQRQMATLFPIDQGPRDNRAFAEAVQRFSG